MSRRLILALTASSALLLPVMLFAADPAGEHEALGLTNPVLSSFMWGVIVFVIVCGLLAKFAWGPIAKALDEREGRIRESLEAAEKARTETERLNQEHAQLMAEARKEATAIVDEGKRDAVALKDSIVADAKRESEAITTRAKSEIERAKELAIHELHVRSVEVSYGVAEKLIQKSLSREDQDKLVDESLKRYSNLN